MIFTKQKPSKVHPVGICWACRQKRSSKKIIYQFHTSYPFLVFLLVKVRPYLTVAHEILRRQTNGQFCFLG